MERAPITYAVFERKEELEKTLKDYGYLIKGVSVFSRIQRDNAIPLGFFGGAYFYVHPEREKMSEGEKAEQSRLLRIADEF